MNQGVVVIIEDDPQMRRFLRASLGGQGFRTHEAETGHQGLILAGNRKPDLLILDLGLPDMDGVEVVKSLRLWTGLPVIVLSARSRESDKIEALDAGADDYLTKPFGIGELLARIRVALRRRSAAAEAAGAVFAVGELGLIPKRAGYGWGIGKCISPPSNSASSPPWSTTPGGCSLTGNS